MVWYLTSVKLSCASVGFGARNVKRLVGGTIPMYIAVIHLCEEIDMLRYTYVII